MPRPRKKVASVNHDGLSRPSPSQKVEEGGNDNDNNLLGQYITKEYELLRLVLSYLPLRDLYSASRVCTAWKAAVACIQRSRRKLHWLFWHCRQNGPSKEEVPHQMFSEYFFSEPQLCLAFMTQWISEHPVLCKDSSVPCPSPVENGSLCNSQHQVINYIKAELPQECPCISIEGPGIVGSSHDLTDTMEVEDGFNGYSSIFVPKVPGVSVTVFLLTKPDTDQVSKKVLMTPEEVEEVTKIPHDEPVQCLLLFCRRPSPAVDVIVKSLMARQPESFAVGGGLFSNVNASCPKKRIYLVGVAFSGEGVHAASTILGHSVTSANHVEVKMEMFRSHCLPAPQSIGFMFACLGRGVDWYHHENVESNAFCQHFPNTPLVGFFGNGEIGVHHLPAVPRETGKVRYPRSKTNPYITAQHSYSTVFVYVAFEPKV